MKFIQGTTIYTCFKDGSKHCIGSAKVEEAIQEYTPKGRAKKPKYRLSLNYFTRGGKSEITLAEDYMDGYSESAVEAVQFALRRLFRSLDKPSAEERLLRAIFGDASCNPTVTEANLSEVINDLISIEKALAEAHKIDAKSNELKRGTK